MKHTGLRVGQVGVIVLILGSMVLLGWDLGSTFDGDQSTTHDQEGQSQSWDKKLPNLLAFYGVVRLWRCSSAGQ